MATATYSVENKTTRENATERVRELAHVVAYLSGISSQGAVVLAQLITGLEIRITELEEEKSDD